MGSAGLPKRQDAGSTSRPAWWVKDLVLLQLRCRSQLWLISDPLVLELHMPHGAQKRRKEKKRQNSQIGLLKKSSCVLVIRIHSKDNDTLYSARNYTQYLIIIYNRKESEQRTYIATFICMCNCITLLYT